MSFKVHDSFKNLEPVQVGLPFALKDLFAHVADEKARNETLARHVVESLRAECASAFDYMSEKSVNRQAEERVSLCSAAQKSLEYYRDAVRADAVVLDVSKDVVEQLAAMLPQLKK